jgi:hypothetical protein
MPVSLAAAEMAIVHDLARPVAPDKQADFVAAVVERLDGASALGPGVVFRAAAEIQSAFLTPIADPRIGGAQSRRRV